MAQKKSSFPMRPTEPRQSFAWIPFFVALVPFVVNLFFWDQD